MRCVLVDANCFLCSTIRDYPAGPLQPDISCFEGLQLLRKTARVLAVVDSMKYANWIFEQRRMLVHDLGFSIADVIAPPLRSAADGDVYLSPSALVLRAWKARKKCDPALLWHIPENHALKDEPIWTRVCDWKVVAWFARGGRSLAVGS